MSRWSSNRSWISAATTGGSSNSDGLARPQVQVEGRDCDRLVADLRESR